MWQRYPSAFAILTPKAQWEVHDFYQPSKELTKEQLLAHRRQISRERPSLPAAAGKHFDILNDYFRSDRELPKTEPSLDRSESAQGAGNRQVRVRALVRPEPNLKLLASALVDLAIELNAKEGGDKATRK